MVSGLVDPPLVLLLSRCCGHQQHVVEYPLHHHLSLHSPLLRAYAGIISLFINAAIGNENLSVNGNSVQTRHFTFADDVVECDILAALAGLEDEVYNAGGRGEMSILELAYKAIELTKSDLSLVHAPPPIGGIRDSFAYTSKDEENLGYRPTIRIEEGLDRTIARMKQKRSPLASKKSTDCSHNQLA